MTLLHLHLRGIHGRGKKKEGEVERPIWYCDKPAMYYKGDDGLFHLGEKEGKTSYPITLRVSAAYANTFPYLVNDKCKICAEGKLHWETAGHNMGKKAWGFNQRLLENVLHKLLSKGDIEQLKQCDMIKFKKAYKGKKSGCNVDLPWSFDKLVCEHVTQDKAYVALCNLFLIVPAAYNNRLKEPQEGTNMKKWCAVPNVQWVEPKKQRPYWHARYIDAKSGERVWITKKTHGDKFKDKEFLKQLVLTKIVELLNKYHTVCYIKLKKIMVQTESGPSAQLAASVHTCAKVFRGVDQDDRLALFKTLRAEGAAGAHWKELRDAIDVWHGVRDAPKTGIAKFFPQKRKRDDGSSSCAQDAAKKPKIFFGN